MRKQVIPHPLLFALFPSLLLFSANAQVLPLDIVVPTMAITAVSALLCWLLLSLALKSKEKAAVLLSLSLLLFFSYGYLGRAWPVVAGLFLAAACFVVKTQGRLYAASSLLNVMGTTLVVMSVVFISWSKLGTRAALEDSLGMQDLGSDPEDLASTASLPNIYYIILDGYARADVLDELYQFDNSEFLHLLERRGFYVAERSRANYAQTALSLASSLNMQYLDGLAARVGVESSNRQPLRKLIYQSAVFRFVKQHGYKLVAFSTPYLLTPLKEADVYLAPGWILDRFQVALLNTTPIPTILSRLTGYDEYDPHRKTVLFALDHLAEVPDQEAPVFVFAHIWVPHPPFVFGEHGEKVNPQQVLAFADGSEFLKQTGATADEYQDNYTAQLSFVNQRIGLAVDGILAKATRPTVIVLQADHGPGSRLDWEDVQSTDMRERLAILNAYYLPGGSAVDLYDEISPVNTFRLIFNRYFGTEYELLADQSFFSSWDRPYQFIAVRDQIQ